MLVTLQRILLSLTALALLHSQLRAEDALFLETVAFGGAVTRTWTTPKKQRTEVTADPGSDFAKMMSDIGADAPQIRIVRLDLGVAWNLNPADQTYTEEPLTLPHEPLPAPDSGEPPPEEPPPAQAPPVQLKEAPNPRTFAGHSAIGLELWADDKRLGTLWVAPLQGPLAQAQTLLETFHQNEIETRFKDWPAKDRALFQGEPDLLAATPVAGTFWGGAAVQFEKLRRNFVLALQAGQEEPGIPPDTLLMQVRDLKLAPPPPDAFTLPEGYKKTLSESGH
ncbi:MAG: hypothetical protein SNJ84_05995 [Verrucomicrobiia bacterium]